MSHAGSDEGSVPTPSKPSPQAGKMTELILSRLAYLFRGIYARTTGDSILHLPTQPGD